MLEPQGRGVPLARTIVAREDDMADEDLDIADVSDAAPLADGKLSSRPPTHMSNTFCACQPLCPLSHHHSQP